MTVTGTASVATAATTAPTDWLDVTDPSYGAVGDGAADDAPAINKALAACPSGGVVYLPAGTYAVARPLEIPSGVTLRGTHGNHLQPTLSSVQPRVDFSGQGLHATPDDVTLNPAVIRFLDKETWDYNVLPDGHSSEQRVVDISIDGSRLPGGRTFNGGTGPNSGSNTVDGIQAYGLVHSVVLQDVSITGVGGRGIATPHHTMATSGANGAYSWRGTRIVASHCGGHGFSLSMTDCTWIDLEAIGCKGSGFYVVNASNSQFIGCRAEFNEVHGLQVTGTWSSGQGAGGCSFANFSTDRNNNNGVYVDAQGTSPVLFNGLMLRRDGSYKGAGGGGFAGLKIQGATTPVVVSGVTVFPGVEDDGSGVNSPQYGVAATGAAFVSVTGGYLQAAQAPVRDGGSNTVFHVDPAVGRMFGATSAPQMAPSSP
ncbi:glycosyl hydrolase family 28-related protein [Streptomyces sp. NPDC047081]|uniref:right-handed parallel beta-helix repeat-containing protein n=1 Tax=Streptomyces sp. NPDC047081 TaxID=3154706 RepID=UPI0033DD4278